MHLVQFSFRLWKPIESLFEPDGKIIPDTVLHHFFKELHRRLIKCSLESQKKGEKKLRFIYSSAADMIGSGSTLTITQNNTRRDCSIVFKAAYVPNTKLILTDDHRFLETIADQEKVKNIFWETSLSVFKVDL